MEGFREGNPGGIRIKSEQKQQTDFAGTPSNETAKRMQREIVCLQQQMAFLKKVMKLHEKQEK